MGKGINSYALSQDRPEIFSHVLSSISFIYSVRINLLPHSMQRNDTPRQPKVSCNFPSHSRHFRPTSLSGPNIFIFYLIDLCFVNIRLT